jgi:hypothetical protein
MYFIWKKIEHQKTIFWPVQIQIHLKDNWINKKMHCAEGGPPVSPCLPCSQHTVGASRHRTG